MFEYLFTTTPVASLLVWAGLLMLSGAYFGKIAWQGLGPQAAGVARLVALVTGGVCVVFGLFLLIGAPSELRSGSSSIRIESAIYGAVQVIPPTVPPFPALTLDCAAYARPICDTHHDCSLTFTNGACGRDPAGGVMKIAEVNYRCGDGPLTTAFFVERRPGTLVCR